MIKLLHTADWHLDAPMGGDEYLKKALLQVPEKLARLCKAERCQLVLISGDVFDGTPSFESLHALKLALQEMAVPVFISPGNHDYVNQDSPWLRETWPENVHIFTKPALESVALPELNCRIYGAGFDAMDCAPLLEKFKAEGEEAYQIAVLHGDPTQKNSPYNPISQSQIGASGLTYLALGHIHKAGSLRHKGTLCAWPGCPMGRGFDELEEKGAYIVTLEDKAQAEFVSLDTPRFFDKTADILTDGLSALESLLPPAGSQDYYRIRLRGESEPLDLAALRAQFPQFPHLELRDETVPVSDLWGCIGEDSLEGVYFGLLHEALETADEQTRHRLLLAAKISRKLLDGREVSL